MQIVITGASSGIGAALAEAYAAAGVRLHLSGRNLARLEAVAARCRLKGAEAFIQVLDVTDREAMAQWLQGIGQLDIVIANAGISAGTGELGETTAQAQAIFATNLDGVLNTVHPALDVMRTQGQGQIVLISSLAGFVALPSAPAYGASKAAVRLYGEALAMACRGSGVDVTVICPGFIKTPMTAVNRFPMPFLQELDAAAAKMKHAITARRGLFIFPKPLYAMIFLLQMLPWGVFRRIMAAAPKKTSF